MPSLSIQFEQENVKRVDVVPLVGLTVHVPFVGGGLIAKRIAPIPVATPMCVVTM